MTMVLCNSWNPLPSQISLCSLFFFFYVITVYYFHLVIPLLATELSFNLTNTSPQLNAEIVQGRDANVSTEGIQLTPDEGEKVGRATYKDPLFLWNKTTGKCADFNTYFSFIIDSNSSNYGDGFTFFLTSIVADGLEPIIGGGGAMGLPIDGLTVKPTNQFVAVEFDTFPNVGWDTVNTTHIGIDINSLKSNATAIWYVQNGIENEAWISYDSSSQNLSIIVTNSRMNQSLSFFVDLMHYLPEWVTIGFSASTGSSFQKNIVKSWMFNSTIIDVLEKPGPSPSPSTINKKALVVGLIVGSFVLVGGLALLGFVLWKTNSRAKEDSVFTIELSMDNEFEVGTGPKKFSYGELFRATNYFAKEQKLGEGGFGGVYKGFLRELNSYIAVKRISKGSKQGMKEYASEVKIISRLRHRNLVQLLGWCHEKRELLLVYEFMENGSLDYHLFKEKSLLTWAIRYKIAQGLASALLYLHEEWEQCVLHRDIKSSNVMLDSNFNAKLGDFGLARLVDHGKGSQTTVLAGTMGYIAPECLVTGKASKESDVFSFGIVALEIACGRKPIDLKVPESQIIMVEWVWDLYGIGKLLEATVDPKICPDFVNEEMECLMIVGLWCAHPDHNLRPSIRQAINVLNFEAPLPILPAKMPVPTYFTLPVNASTLVSLTYGSTMISNNSQV